MEGMNSVVASPTREKTMTAKISAGLVTRPMTALTTAETSTDVPEIIPCRSSSKEPESVAFDPWIEGRGLEVTRETHTTAVT
jgi:hypothetical protein